MCFVVGAIFKINLVYHRLEVLILYAGILSHGYIFYLSDVHDCTLIYQSIIEFAVSIAQIMNVLWNIIRRNWKKYQHTH